MLDEDKNETRDKKRTRKQELSRIYTLIGNDGGKETVGMGGEGRLGRARRPAKERGREWKAT